MCKELHRCACWVCEEADANCARRELLHQFNQLTCQTLYGFCKAAHSAPWPRVAGHQVGKLRIGELGTDDWQCWCNALEHLCRTWLPTNENIGSQRDELLCERRQSLHVAFAIAIIKFQIFFFNKTVTMQTVHEGSEHTLLVL